MNVHDWALVTFTILVQMCVGAVWVLGIMHYFAARKYGMQTADRLSDWALLALVPVIALAFLASLLHLGNPLNAYRAVSNLGSSWLSREIFFGVLFAALTTVFAFMQWRKMSTFALRNVIAWLAALAGLVLVFCMSNIYMLKSQPAWNSWATPVSFFATTFLLGSLAVGAAFVVTHARLRTGTGAETKKESELLRSALRWIAIVAMVLVGIELVILPLYLATLASGGATGLASVKLMIGSFSWMLALRIILGFIGAGIFGMFLFQNAASVGQEKVLANLAIAAFVTVLAAELLGRVLFYATHLRVGV